MKHLGKRISGVLAIFVGIYTISLVFSLPSNWFIDTFSLENTIWIKALAMTLFGIAILIAAFILIFGIATTFNDYDEDEQVEKEVVS